MSSSNIKDVSVFRELPRDMLLEVVSKFDMDTRIKIGLIRKLRIPQKLNEEITKSCKFKIPNIINKTTIKIPISDFCGYELDYWCGSWHCNWVMRYGW